MSKQTVPMLLSTSQFLNASPYQTVSGVVASTLKGNLPVSIVTLGELELNPGRLYQYPLDRVQDGLNGATRRFLLSVITTLRDPFPYCLFG